MDSSLDMSFNEDQEAIRAAVDRFCTQQNVEQFARQSDAPFPWELWRQLAQLGIFCPAAPGHEEAGGALEVCAISESLGHHVFPGPIAATFLAVQLVDASDVSRLTDGRSLVSVSSASSSLLPVGTEADLFLIVDNNTIALAHKPTHVDPVSTLGGEIWGRASLKSDKQLTGASRGLTLGNIASAAYLIGAAWRLLKDASEHAATRKQFGKTLGEFQAISHPLADCAISLTGAQTLVRAAACSFDSGDSHRAQQLGAAAMVSARRASLNTAFACHQVFSGIGITLEGPVFHITRRIRQLASTPPTDTREQHLLLAEAGLGV